MTALIIALAVLFSGTGVVAASDAAKPGDALFGIDLAVERVRMSLASEEHRNELARAFAQERLEEIQKLRGDGSVDDDTSSASSTSGLTEAEAEVFTNETLVKVEINNRKFGFTTDSKTREALITEIAVRYDIDRLIVDSVLVLKVEDRASRPDDKEFLNSEVRAGGEVSLDDDEKHDVQVGLDQVLKALSEDNASSSLELRAALQGILDSSASGKIKIESDGQKMEFRFKDGSIEMKIKSEDDSDDDSSDDKGGTGKDSKDDSDERFRIRLQGDVTSSSDDLEDDSVEGLDDSVDSILGDDSDSDDDSGRSGSGSDDDSSDDDSHGSGSGKDDKDDDD